jgi:signal transduction histidine kinase
VNATALASPAPRSSWAIGGLGVSAVVAVLCELDVWAPLPFVGHQSHRLLLGAVFLATSIALAFRRKAPLTVLGFVYTINALLYLAVAAPEALGSFLPPLVALYAVGRYSPARNLVLAAPLALLGTALHELRDPQFQLGGPTIFFWAMLTAAWPLGRAFRQREEAVEALAERAQRLERGREEEAQAARAAERERIARELHDIVGHGVSLIVLQLVAASGMLEKPDPAAASAILKTTERSARQTLAEMRRLLGLLDESESASLTPQPGLSDVDRLVADTRAAGLDAELAVRGDPVALPAGLELAVYRVAQEALTNVIKHAQPASARVNVTYGAQDLQIVIADDGDSQPALPDGGRGIAGMRERVALYGGDLNIGPRPGGGFAVSARFPIEDA